VVWKTEGRVKTVMTKINEEAPCGMIRMKTYLASFHLIDISKMSDKLKSNNCCRNLPKMPVKLSETSQ
jgi:hypothetical protein